MGSVDGSELVSERALSVAGAAVISVVNPLDVAKDSTVRVISRVFLVQRARREREKFDKRERVILKAFLAQIARFELERFAKRARLEHDTIAQEQVTDKEKGQTKEKGIAMPKGKENVDLAI